MVSDLVRALLRQVKTRASIRTDPPVRLTTCDGNGLQAGVDLDDTAALLDLMS